MFSQPLAFSTPNLSTPPELAAKDTTDFSLLTKKQWQYVQRLYRISPRELEVAILICRGYANAEVAKKLKIKDATVKTHLRNLYRRLRVGTKVQMLLKFVDTVRTLGEDETERPA